MIVLALALKGMASPVGCFNPVNRNRGRGQIKMDISLSLKFPFMHSHPLFLFRSRLRYCVKSDGKHLNPLGVAILFAYTNTHVDRKYEVDGTNTHSPLYKTARLLKSVATRGCSIPYTFLSISKARLSNGSTSGYTPMLVNIEPKLFKDVATLGCHFPRQDSRTASERSYSSRASSNLWD